VSKTTASVSSGDASRRDRATVSGSEGQGDVGGVVVELSAAIIALADESPQTLLVRAPGDVSPPGLPCGPFDPLRHRTLEEGLRSWVGEQTGLHVGYVEQLYTFGDRDRDPGLRVGGARPVSVGYLALVRQAAVRNPSGATWNDWYRYFPWEDWRDGPSALLESFILPRLTSWCNAAKSRPQKQQRRERTDLTFGHDGGSWDNERVLERYELLFEAGLVAEAVLDGEGSPVVAPLKTDARSGVVLTKDHRRILATGMGRLRGKIKYRPVIFELMPPTFTLFQLQRAVEALSGSRLHKQNFRRLVAHEGLVEPTGKISSQTGGRPAELFRFRREVVHERRAPGVRVPLKVNKRPG
jgi:hypothetical protein